MDGQVIVHDVPATAFRWYQWPEEVLVGCYDLCGIVLYWMFDHTCVESSYISCFSIADTLQNSSVVIQSPIISS